MESSNQKNNDNNSVSEEELPDDEEIWDDLGPVQVEMINDFTMKVDFDTSLESFFFIAAIFSVLAFLGLLFKTIADPNLWKLTVLAFAAAVFFYYANKKTDNYYIFDKLKRNVYFHRSIFFFRIDKKVCSFKEIFCITQHSKRIDGRGGPRWIYNLAVLLKDGTFIDVSDSDDFNCKSFKTYGKKISQWLETIYISGKKNFEIDFKTKPITSKNDIVYISSEELALKASAKRKRQTLIVLIIIVCIITAIYAVVKYDLISKFLN